ncbi:MAG: ATP-dependent DNA helicase RecG [Candidatus Magasanikbacteria bacterium]|nr:ATP-dependent DNA helicase RecG [Candidatus Magasanikbacteria bacterium]
MQLSTPISQFSRVGKTTAKHLERVGVRIAKDILYYFPFRYEDFRNIVPIVNLHEGSAVTVTGKLELIANRRSFRTRRTITEALISDATGSIRVLWFNQPFLTESLRPGDELLLSGIVKADMLGPQLVSPVYEKKTRGEPTHTARIVPMYPLTGGVTQKQMRFLIKQALPMAEALSEWLPESLRRGNDLISLSRALTMVHFPSDMAEAETATKRLKFDELFTLQLQAALARRELSLRRAPKITFHEAEIKSFVKSLPFTLTKFQKVAAWEILKDIEKTLPMNRLLSGDVGSGKTVVAAMALYTAVLNDYQAVLMAPTEVLAEQHYASLTILLHGRARVGLLTRSSQRLSSGTLPSRTKVAQKRELIKIIKSGEIDIIVGTQALLEDAVNFRRLALVIVDEQHRFGVAQRSAIKTKGQGAHFLSMTATPIPRSLALLLYGDLDVSQIRELPPGRKPIITRLVDPANRGKAYQFIREQTQRGRQVFVVCPLIEDAHPESVEKKSVLSEYTKLSQDVFPDLRVRFLHGKLKTVEKEATLRDFKNRQADILVATSVIEVGIDIPNASIMMIEGAERFGLAQLHQFRGRVGRSSHQSYCLLFTEDASAAAEDRLKYFEHHNDGFALAEKDLELRGPGEVYGTEQSGLMQLRLATLADRDLIKDARAAAEKIALEIQKYPAVARHVGTEKKVLHLE